MATYGELIEKLIDEYGQDTMGIWCLEQALSRVLEIDDSIVLINGKLISEYPAYLRRFEEEKRLLELIRAEMYLPVVVAVGSVHRCTCGQAYFKQGGGVDDEKIVTCDCGSRYILRWDDAGR